MLRRQNVRASLEGDTYTEWGENDYAVSEDRVIGRIYQMEAGPQGGTWLWFLNMLAMPGDLTGVVMSGGERSLEAAKAALKVEYEKWRQSKKSP